VSSARWLVRLICGCANAAFCVGIANRQGSHKLEVSTFQASLEVSLPVNNHLIGVQGLQPSNEIKPIPIDDEIKPIVINEAAAEESKEMRPALIPKLKLAN
jgi:hypothetical protein